MSIFIDVVPPLLFAGSAILTVVGLHPFVTYPLSLLLFGKLRPARAALCRPRSAHLRYAICTCAYNEEKVIGAKLRNMIEVKKSSNRPVDLFLYVDAAGDSTADIAYGFEDQVTVVVGDERHGKTHGMNRLVELTDADILIFTDANVMLDIDMIQRLEPYFAAAEVGCVCGNLNYVNGDQSVTAATGSLYWKLEEFIKREESKHGSVMGADGSLFALRRILHRPPPDHLIDDMYVSMQVLCDGHQVLQASDVKAFEASVSVAREEFRRKIRIACQAFNVHRVLWPRLMRTSPARRYMYVSHKLLRWFSIYFLAAGASLFELGMVASGAAGQAALLLVSGVAILLVGARWSITPVSQMVNILVALLGAGLGVWNAFLGHQFQTWSPAASLRR